MYTYLFIFSFSEICVRVISRGSPETQAALLCSLVSANCSSHLGEDAAHCEILHVMTLSCGLPHVTALF